VRTSELAQRFSVSRAFAHRVLQDMQREGLVTLVGRSNRARYVPATADAVAAAKRAIHRFQRTYQTQGLAEDVVLQTVKAETGIFLDLPENVRHILEYTFTEMLNNAIEHARSAGVRVTVERTESNVRFVIVDHGVGIFANLMEKFSLTSELDAINQLLKGKHTTAPEAHSGEGIFFTSRAADQLVIRSARKKLVFENADAEPDVYPKTLPTALVGTSVRFSIETASARELGTVFRRHTSEEYSFDTTDVRIRLYREGTPYFARSQARRVTAGLERFKNVTIDFANVPTIGQAFADEIFRVWKNRHPHVHLTVENANEDVEFMVRRAQLAA